MYSLSRPKYAVRSLDIIILLFIFLYSSNFLCIDSFGFSELIAETKALQRRTCFCGSGKDKQDVAFLHSPNIMGPIF